MANSSNLRDIRIDIKHQLSALWITLVCCYIYGDFFSLFVPGRIENLINGQSGTGATTPSMLLVYAIMMTLPSLMIFFSVLLKAKWNRLLNIGTGILFTAIMVLVVITSLNRWMIFYTYLGIIEIILTSTIVWLAFKWPRE